ncbi:PREDICTED: E3 ubiquitin-protein ligase XIAP-like isoform X2 [Amphimedon queenslandica]|uniref:RING-type domain-containing protein n=1 Tax=Amphimedon queenslandica TaxID=400682 RepID=A0AAN0J2V9_AMPQE|nr:PREDICTED: E3 ubiquitin-protein ligase XIAP-like isoform X2 [Amphimedon queenslandica]|eukprot:XP_019851374.1 PREDICTED: E3 ubiquitin-protein ligase XIAP-like isoform X2 [Amphimedon queenslandica]
MHLLSHRYQQKQFYLVTRSTFQLGFLEVTGFDFSKFQLIFRRYNMSNGTTTTTRDYSHAENFSRDHYRNFLVSRDVSADGDSLKDSQQFQKDGRDRENRKKSSSNYSNPSRRAELVGGMPLNQSFYPSSSQRALPRRKDEMVVASCYYDQVAKPRYHKSISQNSGQERLSRSKERESRKERKRSVSPQIKSSRSAISSKLANEVKMPIVRVQKGVKKHKKERLDLSCYDMRVKTFNMEPSWTNDPALITSLASYGFYFTGHEDITECFSCHGKIEGWKSKDDVLFRHFEMNPNCKHIRENYYDQIQGICSENEVFSMYKDSKVRESSFQYWPIPRDISGSDLSKAGWFYTGKDDITRCFACGCQNEDWKKGDDPLEIHKKLSNKCSFVSSLPDYSKEDTRLQSFRYYPSKSIVSVSDLVQSGFYLLSTNPVPRVKCWSCNIEADVECMEGKGPAAVHIMMNPDCKIAQLQDPEDVSSFPKPIMTRTQLQNIYRPQGLEDSEASNATKSMPLAQIQKRPSTNYSLPHYTQSPISSLNQELADSTLEDNVCVVCLDNRKQYAIVPCGHLCVCYDCSEQLLLCPICRVRKEDALRIFS